jgi:hypothetical protein
MKFKAFVIAAVLGGSLAKPILGSGDAGRLEVRVSPFASVYSLLIFQLHS